MVSMLTSPGAPSLRANPRKALLRQQGIMKIEYQNMYSLTRG